MEDDAADAEMTELESAGPEALPRTVGKKGNAFVFRGDNTGHKGKKSKTKHAGDRQLTVSAARTDAPA